MSDDRFEKGLETRRAVLGDAYVDNSLSKATDFTQTFQEYVTTYCWNDLWNRPGLDHKTRSIINLAMLAALNRPHEFRVHCRGAVNNGVTKDEMKEIFLQIGVYAGVPASLEAFKIAQEVFDDMGV